MRTLAIQYEDSLPFALGESPAAFEKEAVFLLALKLFELGRVSAGKAADFCGLSSVRLDEDQLEAEFSNA